MLWWIAAGIVVGAELFTGTVYLLLLAVGMAAAGWAAHMGATTAAQMLVCAVVGGFSMALLWQWRRHKSASAGGSHRMDLDIGQRVHVDGWSADGQAAVHYRGAPWQASWSDAAVPPPGPGEYAIVAVNGARLVLGPVESRPRLQR